MSIGQINKMMESLKQTVLFAFPVLAAMPAWAALNVPLTVQEALYSGVPGITRTNEPFCQGVPLADSQAISSTNVLGLSGATAGQFRALGIYPSGHLKWVEVCGIISNLSGGGTATVTLTDTGAGNFGGANLATDNGSTITVNTAAATFTVKKAYFNVVDQVVVGDTIVVASGSSQGLVVTGPSASTPYPGSVTCTAGSCTVQYSSANDPNSICLIEKNGPVEAVVKCSGNHVDANGNVYMHFTVREYFHQGQTRVKVNSILRNADYGTSNTLATAYKGLQAYELRLTTSGTDNYTFATDTGTQTGSLAGTQSAYLYQGKNTWMQNQYWCNAGAGCIDPTTDMGYWVYVAGTNVATGSSSQYAAGWADISTSAGTGVEIGVYQMAAYYPKSLEFNNGGTDVRIGIWAGENSQPFYMPWPQYSIHDLFLNFHSTTPASLKNEFLKFQHPLLARATVSYYNLTEVFPYPLVDPATEDAYYTAVVNAANPHIDPARGCCITDYPPGTGVATGVTATRFWYWPDGGGNNQAERAWENMQTFLKRGFSGRWLDSVQFYRMIAEKTFPRADGFTWRSRASSEIDPTYGFPSAASANSSRGTIDYIQFEHEHWYGTPDYYFLSGDEVIKDALMDGALNYFLETRSSVNNGNNWNSRAIGHHFLGAARIRQFLLDTSDTADAATVLSIQQGAPWTAQVKPALCASGYPVGCTLNINNPDTVPNNTGVSLTRGFHWSAGTATDCPVGVQGRVLAQLVDSILTEGIWALRQASGPSWSDSTLALDYIDGISNWQQMEAFVNNGSTSWTGQGFRYQQMLDSANNCGSVNYTVQAEQTAWMPFYFLQQIEGYSADRERKLKIAFNQLASGIGIIAADWGGYQMENAIAAMQMGTASLQDVPITSFTVNGGGSYTLSWTPPNGVRSYRLKWGLNRIVNWIGFNPDTNTFIGNPATTQNWFASSELAPPALDATTITVNTRQTGLTATHFSLRAMAGQSSQTPASLILTGGNGQSGTAGQALPTPLTVEVIDSSGNPVAGADVIFTTTAGGGSVSSTQTTTNSQGLATTILTLGANSGYNAVSASSGSLTPIVFTATGTAPGSVATILAKVSGDNQTGTPGRPLATPFTAKVTDANGGAVPGVTVFFTVTGGGGSLSAAQATTSAQGLACVTLTLGAQPGVNTVSATSGTLAGSPLIFTATGSVTNRSSQVTWTMTAQTWADGHFTPGVPGFDYFNKLIYDPVSQTTFLYGIIDSSSTIYSSDVFFYDSTPHTWSHLGGMGSTDEFDCNSGTATWPSNRHPMFQMAQDTKRNLIWMWGGVCQGVIPNDMWYLSLNSNSKTDTWTKHNPASQIPPYQNASAVYDPDDDVILSFGNDGVSGGHYTWVYCSTIGNARPGVLTQKQSQTGCTADDWTEVEVTGGVYPTAGINLASLVYDTVDKKAIMFGGYVAGYGSTASETWAYDIPTRTWTNKLPSTHPTFAFWPNVGGAEQGLAYSATNNKAYFQNPGNSAPETWTYDYPTNTWTLLCANCGPANPASISYDAKNNLLVGVGYGGPGQLEVWEGTLGDAAKTCDLNGDGVVDILDTQIAIIQAIGATPCTTADLIGNGICSSVDVQRVTTAALGGVCQIGQ